MLGLLVWRVHRTRQKDYASKPPSNRTSASPRIRLYGSGR